MNAPRGKSLTSPSRQGFLYGLAAYGLWGILPIYFKAIAAVPAVDIVAHRIIWSLPFLAVLILLGRQSGELRKAAKSVRTIGFLTITAALIGVNWLLYVYAVTSGHILAASLGYYLNPLANVLLGRFILKEKLGRLQWLAVAVAGAGIAVLAAGALGQLWLSLSLCASFALYGLLRKIAPVEAVVGLTIETGLLLPLALLWLGLQAAAGHDVMGATGNQTLLLTLAGIVSTTPLLLFTAAARRLRYSTLGMLQFLAPTLQFILAVALYGEAFTLAHAIAFGAIWFALALYVTALARQARVTLTPPE